MRETEQPPRIGAPAVVIGLDCITGLQTARILARHGVAVIALATDLRHFACRTRVCRRIIEADTGSVELVDALTGVGPLLEAKAVIYPCTDLSVLLVSRHRNLLAPWYHVVLPDQAVVEMLMHKTSFAEYAEREGLPVPRSRVVRNRDDAEEAATALTFPCVLKPSVKSASWMRHADAKAYKVSDPRAFLVLYEAAARWIDELLIQEWIDGRKGSLFTCNCYFDRDFEPLVSFMTRKVRQWPPAIGEGSLGEEARNDEVLRETVRVFRSARFRGLGYIEMKHDARTNRYLITEPNIGRPTGRSATAEAGGVELLYTMYCDAVGLPLPTNIHQEYRGTKWIYARRDVLAALHDWRKGDLTLGGWARSLRGPKVEAVFSRPDPLPFCFDLADAALKAARLGVEFVRRRGRSGPDLP